MKRAERKRLARELHDTVAQSLCALVLEADLIGYEIPQDSGPVRERIMAHRQRLSGVVNEFSQLTRRLSVRPSSH